MSIFGAKKKKQKHIIGVDIGAGGVKMVEFTQENKRPKLVTYGYATFKSSSDDTGHALDNPKRTAKIMSRIMKEAKMTGQMANASLPSNDIFHTIITIPKSDKKKEELRSIIESQVKKLLPQPLEEMILDSHFLDRKGKDKVASKKEGKDKKKEKKEKLPNIQGRNTEYERVLVSGSPKVLVQKYIEVFKMAKLPLATLETEAFALIRSLVGKDKARNMIVDIGQERTNITIVLGGIPFLHRSIKTGGGNVTSMISKQMSVSPEEAEQIKKDLAHSGIKDIPGILQNSMAPILHEIKYSLELFKQQDFHSSDTVEKIIITGGSAFLPGIEPFISNALNINVYTGDPWARTRYPAGMRDILDEIGPRFSVAIGLGMKDFI